MTQPPTPIDAEKQESSDFEEAANADELNLIQEFILFLRDNKAWWLVPILLALALIGMLAFFAGSPLAPFIYPLF